MSAIEKFRNKNNVLITFEELSKIPLNETQQLYPDLLGAVEFTRITSNNDNLMFTVSMKKGQLWYKHNHDCIETILLYKGKLRELYKDIIVNRANILKFNKYEPHYVLAEEDSIFYVEFKKPFK